MKDRHKTYLGYLLLSILPLVISFIPSIEFSSIIPEGYFDVVKVLPYLIFLGISFLGLKLNQTRIFFSSLIFLLAYHSLSDPNLMMSLGIGKIRSRQIFAVATPLCFSFLFFLKEYPILSWKSLARLGLSLLPLSLLVLIFAISPEYFVNFIEYQFIAKVPTNIPQISFISIALFLIHYLLIRDRRIALFLTGLTFSLIPFYTAAHIGLIGTKKFHQLLPSNIVCFTAITIILVHAIYKMYWKRVYIDELTEIPNRRAFDEKLESLGSEFAICIMDIDHFKSFNDTYGHAEGDSVLKMVADTLSKVLGENVFRYGGEEFCAVFPEKRAEDCYDKIDLARRTLENREFYIRSNNSSRSKKHRGKAGYGNKRVQVTMSMGIASSTSSASTPDLVIINADKALYEAKETGRNKVLVY